MTVIPVAVFFFIRNRQTSYFFSICSRFTIPLCQA